LGSRAARRPSRGARVEVVSHPDLTRLHPTGPYPESPRRLAVLLEYLDGWQTAEPAAERDLERCHDRFYIEQIQAIAGPTLLDLDTACSETTYEAALLAAGAALAAAERSAFAIARPPGHHALRDRAMGFCFFNNVAVAARWAQAELGLGRVAIVDWDVHHGNGTQAIFWDDPSVLYVSLHQWPLYPGTGGPVEQDETTVNVPLPAGSGDDDYARAWREQVEPAVRRFNPELVLVSAGFDAHHDDPLSDMAVTEEGFRNLALHSASLAPRVGAVLEGGYNLETLPILVAAALEGFSMH
jgi:acetoin utilization deacetylase AcuC-like enzyme